MSRWDDARTWTGDGIRREVFFFRSNGIDLYGSLYVSAELSRPVGVLACSSWGVEADRSDPLVRSVALGMAGIGGAAMVFHYPGYGDSHGDLAAVTMADLTDAATAAFEEASRRVPEVSWLLAGYMFGAGVACLAQAGIPSSRLLLVQPALRSGAYFRWLADYSRRRPLRFAVTEGMAYGYPLPPRILGQEAEFDLATESALEAAGCEVTAIRYAEPAELEPLPESFDLIEVPGTWRFGATLNPELVEGATAWLNQCSAEGFG